MTRHHPLKLIEQRITECTRCPELREYCAEVAATKRRAFIDHDYWGRPVHGFGDRNAEILIVGLAPAAHGANRTGRMFTGDRSGDFLYAALHRAGLASQPDATARDDGLTLSNVYITAACRCAPPANKPTATQQNNCRPWLVEEFQELRPRVILCLGGIGHAAVIRLLRELDRPIPTPQPKFAHAASWTTTHDNGEPAHILCCYHVSQQNTFTGRLTEAMIDDVLRTAVDRAADND